MFCSECGTKNKKGDLFCQECGNKLTNEEVKEKKEVKKETKKVEKKETLVKEKKPMSKKNKALLVIIALLVIVGIATYKYLSDITSPKHIAQDYVKAVINNDSNKLYGYLELTGDKTFVSKKVFKEVYKGETNTKIKNYKVTEVDVKDLTATAKLVYTTEDSDTEHTGSIKLTKEKGKEYFFFDKWKVADISTSSVILEKYTIKVIKDSKLTYAGVEVTNKYLDEDKSTDTYDVYVLPQVFKYETTIKAKLPSGIEIENKVTPSTYYDEITIKMDKNSISKDMEKDILKTSKSVLNDVYEKAMVSRPVDEFTSNYKHKGITLTELEDAYNELVANLSRAVNQLTKIEFKDLSIYSLEVNEDGDFEVQVKADYDYTVEYIVTGGETKTVSKSSYGYMTLIYKYENSKFYLKNLENLKTYFSRY